MNNTRVVYSILLNTYHNNNNRETMYNIYKSFIEISMSVKTCRDFSTLQANAQVHKFTHQSNTWNARTVSTTSRFDTLENTKQHQLRCKTPRQTNTPVWQRQHSKSDWLNWLL